jgi:hypothetical protein
MIRINGYYTEKVQRTFYRNALAVDHYAYQMVLIPVGFRLIRRLPADIDDPIRLGTITASGPGTPVSFANTDYCTINQNASQGDLNSYRLTTIDTTYPWPQVASGTTNITEAAAWADFVSEVADYNAVRTPYQPELVANDTDRSVTLSFMTRENAFYIRTYGCQAEDPFTPQEQLKYDFITVNYGGHLVYQNSSSGTPAALTNIHNTSIHALNLMAGIQERIILDFG